VCWADHSDGLTVNFRCPNARCKAGKGPWDTPEPCAICATTVDVHLYRHGDVVVAYCTDDACVLDSQLEDIEPME
jgi:hypothetical protein